MVTRRSYSIHPSCGKTRVDTGVWRTWRLPAVQQKGALLRGYLWGRMKLSRALPIERFRISSVSPRYPQWNDAAPKAIVILRRAHFARRRTYATRRQRLRSDNSYRSFGAQKPAPQDDKHDAKHKVTNSQRTSARTEIPMTDTVPLCGVVP